VTVHVYLVYSHGNRLIHFLHLIILIHKTVTLLFRFVLLIISLLLLIQLKLKLWRILSDVLLILQSLI